jgi:hypothetical protein
VRYTGDSNSCPSDLELVTLTNSADFSTQPSPECVGTALGCREVALASESASDMPSCKHYAGLAWHQASEFDRKVSLPVMFQAASVMQLDRQCVTCQA